MDEPTLRLPENELNWHLTNVQLGTSYQLTFHAKPGLSLGTESATAKIAATGLNGTVQAPEATSTQITEPGEPANGQPETAQPAQPDTLYLGYTSSGSDRDYFQVHANPGEQLTIHLSHLKVDDDLVIYGPGIAPLRTPHPGAEAPSAGDVPFDLGQRTQSITPEALTDVPQDAVNGQTALDVSDNRGLADEEVSVVSPEGGTYTIQVASFDGGYSNDPWVLRIERSPSIALPSTCTNPQGPGTGVTKAMPAVPTTASTLYLFASKRFGDLYGLQAENDVFSRLQTLAARTDAAGGAVIPVDANAAVLNALNARAADSCSPAKANDVVRAVGNLLDNPVIVRPSVKYIVVVGDDAAGVPFGRVLDNSAYANERGYASTFFGATNNQYLSTYGLGFLPTDDPLGDVNYSGQGPYVPELAVGRLVETPTQILSQITQYITRNGAINPTRALTTGYDFLSDGASRVSADFKARLGTNNAQELISNSWSKNNLLAAMFPTSNPPILDSINAHYDHARALPADENAAQRESILYTTADLAGRSTSGRVIFTMGCHSALPVSDFVFGSSLSADWAQAYAQSGAVVYMGNTGYGLGDTAAVLYTEKLNVLFADRLDGSMTVGQALAFAKQEYAATPTQSGYHLKVIDEANLMGLPMYRVGTGATPAPPTPAVTTTDSATGLPTAPFNVSPSFTRVDTAIGSYYVSDDAFAENRRPIEPTTKLDVTEPGLVAHGALLTALTSTDEANFDAAFSRVIDDFSAFTPELVGDVSYPTKLQSIASLATPNGTRQRLVLFSGQFRSDSTFEPQGVGIQRRFTALSGNVFYAAPNVADFTPSSFGPVEVTKAGTTVGFAVDVTDDVGGAGGVKRVLALYKDATRGLEVDRDVAQLAPLEWRRAAVRQRRRMDHPGRRRFRERRRHQQQGVPQVGRHAAADRRHPSACDRPPDERVVHGHRLGDDQRRAGHQLQPRRRGVHARHLALRRRDRRPLAGLPGKRRLSWIADHSDRRVQPDGDREHDVRLRIGRARELRRLGLRDRLLHRPGSPRYGLGRDEDDPRPRRGSSRPRLRRRSDVPRDGVLLHRLLLPDQQPAGGQRRQCWERRPDQVQPLRFPGSQHLCAGLSGQPGNDLRRPCHRAARPDDTRP